MLTTTIQQTAWDATSYENILAVANWQKQRSPKSYMISMESSRGDKYYNR